MSMAATHPLALVLPPPRVGWAMVAAAHALFALVFGAMYSFGAFFEALQASFQAGRFSVSLVFSVSARVSRGNSV